MVTCLLYVDDMILFTYNSIHNAFTNTGKYFSHAKKPFGPFAYVAEHLVTNLQISKYLFLQEEVPLSEHFGG